MVEGISNEKAPVSVFKLAEFLSPFLPCEYSTDLTFEISSNTVPSIVMLPFFHSVLSGVTFLN